MPNINENQENTNRFSKEIIKKKLNEASNYEQIYSIALFDILGFSNFVEQNGTNKILSLYNKLLDLIYKQDSSYDNSNGFPVGIIPSPISKDCKSNIMIANAGGYINVCHFSDTFIIYVNYLTKRTPELLATPHIEEYPLLIGEPNTEYCPIVYEHHDIYLTFLQTCMEFFCQSIVSGIPLRGCVATGPAMMNKEKSIFFGTSLVEAARGEGARDSMGICFGKSFNNYHPIYNDFFIPYYDNIKTTSKSAFISPMMLDWAKYWRNSDEFSKYDFFDCINKMNTNTDFSKYYDNTINFFNFSEDHKNWYNELNRDGVTSILDYYEKTKNWYDSTK